MATISRGTKAERFEFIGRYKDQVNIKRLCEHLEVSRSGYYNWVHHEESLRCRSDKQLLERITRIFNDNEGIYGSPRIHLILRSQGFFVGRKRVARLMRSANLRARFARVYRNKARKSRSGFAITDNLILEDKSTTSINTHWTMDLTYLSFGKQWLYLAVVMDLHSRRIVGWSLGEQKNSKLAQRAIQHAINKRKPRKGLILHSDRGSEFVSHELKQFTDRFGIVRSMSRPYKSIDNAEIESFFQKLKGEYIIGKLYKTQKALRKFIAYYINRFYNPKRLHSSLGYLSPMKFEAIHA